MTDDEVGDQRRARLRDRRRSDELHHHRQRRPGGHRRVPAGQPGDVRDGHLRAARLRAGGADCLLGLRPGRQQLSARSKRPGDPVGALEAGDPHERDRAGVHRRGDRGEDPVLRRRMAGPLGRLRGDRRQGADAVLRHKASARTDLRRHTGPGVRHIPGRGGRLSRVAPGAPADGPHSGDGAVVHPPIDPRVACLARSAGAGHAGGRGSGAGGAGWVPLFPLPLAPPARAASLRRVGIPRSAGTPR